MTEVVVASEGSSRRPALAGIRILDFTIAMAGPYCTRLLADLGAEVIKIEAFEGDFIRNGSPRRGPHSAFFGQLNSGKRSVVIDLKKPEGRAIARDLAAAADVVVESFRPGVMGRLGLGYGILAAANARLIYCSVMGVG
jgi:CoA:oxalate CoA-transferase